MLRSIALRIGLLVAGLSVLVAPVGTTGGIDRAHESALSSAQTGAQPDDAEPLLVLFNYDPEHPALFQALALDAAPDPRAFAPRLELLPDAEAPQSDLPETIYIAIENTAWSEGAVGLTGSELSREAEYVMVEVWLRMGHLVLRDDGQGLFFSLTYERDLGETQDSEDVPGFRLDVLIMQQRMFRLYRVVEEEGLSVWGTTHVRDGNLVDSQLISTQIDPMPVFGDLVFDFHIVGLLAPTPTPEVTPTLLPEPAVTVTGTPPSP
jgi:hypothetical protein